MAGKRQDLRDLWRNASMASLVSFPLPLLRNYMPAFGPMYLGVYPIVLLVSPLVLFALRRRTLLWLVAAGIATYALIVRLPLLGIPYIYLTYFEILYSPVRNFVFFVYLLTGIALYLAAARLARLGYVAGTGLALALGVSAAWALRRSEPFFTTHPEWLFLPLLAGYAIALAVIITRRDPSAAGDAWIDEPSRPWIPALAALVAPLIVMTAVPGSSIRTMSWEQSRKTPPSMLVVEVCDNSHTYCPPPEALVQLAHSVVPPEAVFAVDQSEEWPPSLFMPQQMAMWPGRVDALYEPERLFAAYYRHYDRARQKYEAQPLFNDRETREERVEFIRDVGVTHVLVNPRTYAMMTMVLARDPDLFEKRYDDGRWAWYEVRRSWKLT